MNDTKSWDAFNKVKQINMKRLSRDGYQLDLQIVSSYRG